MKILYLYADEMSFWRNRLDLACEAKAQGFDVVLMAPLSNYRSEIEKEGIRVIPWNLSRKSVNPLRELRSLLEVARIYRQERPDIVQQEALKAILHGGTPDGSDSLGQRCLRAGSDFYAWHHEDETLAQHRGPNLVCRLPGEEYPSSVLERRQSKHTLEEQDRRTGTD